MGVGKVEEYRKDKSFSKWEHNTGKKFDLKGNEILAYTLIRNFSENNGCYKGGRSYLAECLNCRPATVQSVLDVLVEKGLVEKIPVNSRVKFYYRTCCTETVQQKNISSTKNASSQYGNRTSGSTDFDNLQYGNRTSTSTETVHKNKRESNENKQGKENKNKKIYVDSELNLWKDDKHE